MKKQFDIDWEDDSTSLEDKAAMVLEELHISGDTMVDMDHSLDDLAENYRNGAFNLHDIMASFAEAYHQERSKPKLMDQMIEALRLLIKAKDLKESGNTGDEYLNLKQQGWNMAREIVDKARDFTGNSNGWISVEDELPKQSITVLLIYGGHTKTGYLRSVGHLKDKWGIVGGGVTNGVTHWQNLPEPK